MNKVLIVFASSTSANQVKRVLSKKYGIKSTLIQAPKALNLSGCSYCLELNREDMETAWQLISANGLSSKGIYDIREYRRIK